MTIDRLEPLFVEFMPKQLQPGTLYISTTYRTTAHLCASGCGNKVVLPLSPAEWRLTFDGLTVSMYPSVGNWEYPCRSHYWIKRSRIEWAGAWSDQRIESARRAHENTLGSYFDERTPPPVDCTEETSPVSLWARVKRFVRGRS